MEGKPAEDATLFPTTVGEKLRGARLAQGLDLAEVAARTRIPQRHLEAIEASNYSGLPSKTYALGFAKAYARAVQADEVAIARDLRAELGDQPASVRITSSEPYEMSDPTRTPSSGLAWVAAIIGVLLVVAAGLFYGTSLFRGSPPPPESLLPTDEPTAAPTPEPTAAAPVTTGQVSLTAIDTVWIRVTDAAGNRLIEKEMQPGERFDVPTDAVRPMLRTSRPEKLQVAINGSNVAALGPAGVPLDVDVSAAALQARGTGATPPVPGATPTPGATPRAQATTAAPLPAVAAPAPASNEVLAD